ncbi:hypothetical protein AMST5_00980 [freshwater sediment metagenome]|uniref:Toprim domain-containing protein n=1 Tax=freshwater sediment metagenome TaxID=556182 RepID=A0AA48M1N2_9ZZZZ
MSSENTDNNFGQTNDGNGHGLPPTVEEVFFDYIVNHLGFGPEEIIADDDIHRFGEDGGDGDGKLPGWYVLHADENDPAPYGSFGNWRTGEKLHWRGQQTRPLTEEEKVAREQRRKERKNADEKKQREIKKLCAELYRVLSADEVGAHFYLERKNVGAHNIIRMRHGNRDFLGIPVCENGEEVVSLQWINHLGMKRFEQGGKIGGCWFTLAPPNDAHPSPIVIVEGYATGATIFEATGFPVMVAFNSGNLEAVAKNVAKKYPGAEIVIAGDDDLKTERNPNARRNPGVEDARKAARAIKTIAVFPPFDRDKDGVDVSDWNDFAALRGKENVGALFKAEVKRAKQHPQSDPRPDSQDDGGDAPPPGDDDIPPPGDGGGDRPSERGWRKPTIEISTDLNADIAACVNALVACPLVEMFQRGGSLVMRGTVKHKAHDGQEILSEAVLQHSTETMRTALGHAAIFGRWNAKAKRLIASYPPTDLCMVLVKCSVDEKIPVLRGTICAPTLRADGSILDKPGYDPASGLYYDPKGVDFGTIPEFPTKEDAQAALQVLDGLICKFPFVDDPSKSVALARYLTGAIRFSLEFSPIFEFVAPQARTGKSLLNDIGTMITEGHAAPVIAASKKPDELDTDLVAELRSGAHTITLDNLPNGEVLRSELLCQMATQTILKVRAFHTNDKLIQLPNVSLVVINGNNIAVGADLTERLVRCAINANMENPGQRKFDFNPVEVVRADRGKYVRACLTILRAHAVAGYPAPDDMSALGGFDDWNKKVRGALLWLEQADPCETMKDIRDADPQRGSLLTLMDEWEAVFTNRFVTVADVIKKAEELAQDEYHTNPSGKSFISRSGDASLLNALDEIAGREKGGHINSRSFGRWMVGQMDVVMGDRKFVRKPNKGKTKIANKIALMGCKDDVEKLQDYGEKF